MGYETIIVDKEVGVTRITLNRPKALNALSYKMLNELIDAARQAANDPDVRCVLLTGSGRGFSSGADLMDPDAKMDMANPNLRSVLDTHYHPLLEILRGMDKPYISAVNGIAAGAGCSIAIAADICVAARSAKFIQVFVRIGLVPDAGGTWTVPRLIGRARAIRWMMTGEDLPAEKAADWGVISEVVDDDDLQDHAMALAKQLAAQPTAALAGIRKLIDASMDNDLPGQLEAEAAIQYNMGYTHDFKEGVMAFVQKRPAEFRGC